MPDLSKEEVERRLEELNSRVWPEGQLQVVELMSGQYQDLLQTALSLYAKLDELAAERDDWRDAAKVNRDEARKLEAVCEAAKVIDEVMPSTYVSNSEGTMRVWIVVEDAEKLRAALAALKEAPDA